MKRGGGDAGDNPRGKTDEQAKVKEWEDRLNRDEDYDIRGASIVSDEREELNEKEKEKEDKVDDKVDMETFKPKFLSKKNREKGGLNDLKEEIELRKQQDLKKKQEQLERIEKIQKEQDNNTEENSNKSKKQENLVLLNQKKKSINDALQQLEKDTTKLKKVKKNLLSFNDDEDDY